MSIIRITKSCISTDMNELRVDTFHVQWEIRSYKNSRTYEGHATDSTHADTTSAAARRRLAAGGGGVTKTPAARRRRPGTLVKCRHVKRTPNRKWMNAHEK
jgi:hypothetical protein